MAQAFKKDSMPWSLLLEFAHYSLALFIGVLLLSGPATVVQARPSQATEGSESLVKNIKDRRLELNQLIKQELVGSKTDDRNRQDLKAVSLIAAAPQDNNTTAAKAYAEGQKRLEQAGQLLEQGTVESRRQAIAKYEEALKIWRAVGDRSFEALTLQGIGSVYFVLAENQKALEYYNQALALRRVLKDRLGEAFALSFIGGAYSNLGEKQKALNAYSQSLLLFHAERKRPLEALTLYRIGGVYSDLGETQKALGTYNQALVIHRAVGDRSGEISTLQRIGLTYAQLGERQKALNSYNEVLKIQRTAGDRLGQADTLEGIGGVYQSVGENQKALNSYNQALALRQAAGKERSGPALAFDRSQQALTLIGIAGIYGSLGDYSKALTAYNQALKLVREAGSRYAEAEILGQISLVYDQLGEKQKALDSLNQALVLQRAGGDRAREAFTLGNIGDIYSSLGEPQKALDTYNQALTLQQAVKDRPGEANTLAYIASVYSDLGDYQLSLDSYDQALLLFRTVGDRIREAQTLDRIAAVYRLSGEYQKALDSAKQALSVARTQGDRTRELAILTTIVRVYESLGDYPQALDAANQALSVARAQRSRFGEASAFAMMGRVYQAAGEYQKALNSAKQAVSLLRKLGFRAAEANALGNLSQAYGSLGKPQEAINISNQELLLRRVLGDRVGEAGTLYDIALVERDRGDLNKARSQIEAVLTIVEELRTKVASQELRASYFASVQKYYKFYTDLLMQLHKQQPSKGYDALALQASERARARSLLEILTEANADIRRGVDPALLERERSLQQQLNAKVESQQRLISGKHTEAQAAILKKEITALLAQYREIEAQIRQKSPRYAALTQPRPLSLKEIQQQVLDNDTLLLEYSLGEERSYLWAVTPTSISSYELPKGAEIDRLAKEFVRQAEDPQLIGTPKGAVALSQMLLGPVAAQLGNKRLLIVSEGTLQYLPFSALPLPKPTQAQSDASLSAATPLFVEHEVVSLPSASTLAVLRHELAGRQPASKALAVLADPVFDSQDERVKIPVTVTTGKPSISLDDLKKSVRESGVVLQRLPGTRQEAEQIVALVPAAERQQALDFAASRATATSPGLSQHRIVHFATHGLLDSANPELSGIVLSLVDQKGAPQDGFLRLHDIYNLNLPAELVVLSACQTGLGKEVKGEGLVGLTRGFMYAGTPRVVASLWYVNDQATAELMERFYKGMLKQGLRPAAALRQAQLEMWRQPQWQAPHYWAAFDLQGEWR